MKSLLAHIFTLISFLFLWPHFIIFIMSSRKKEIYEDTKAIMSKRHVKMCRLLSVFFVILTDSYYRKMFYYRIGSYSYLLKWYFPGCKTFFISRRASISGGVYLAHPFSTFLNVKSIGRNFTCRQNTTLGNKFEGNPNSCPSIGDNVSLGANVCIIGDISIGNNVIIGAGSVVTKSIPDNSVAVGNPARIIKCLK